MIKSKKSDKEKCKTQNSNSRNPLFVVYGAKEEPMQTGVNDAVMDSINNFQGKRNIRLNYKCHLLNHCLRRHRDERAYPDRHTHGQTHTRCV